MKFLLSTILSLVLFSSVMAQTPVAEFDFDDNVIEIQSNETAFSEQTAFIPGKVGSAISFDGADSCGYVSYTPSGGGILVPKGAFSFTAWVYADSTFTPNWITSGYNSTSEKVNFSIETNGRSIRVYLYDDWPLLFGLGPGNNTSFTAFIPESTWFHLGVTVDLNDSLRVYINGESIGTVDIDIDQDTTGMDIDTWRLSDPQSFSCFETGALDQARLYDSAISAAQVMSDYADTTVISSVSPVLDAQRISVFPNPTTDVLTISGIGQQDISVVVRNSLGQVVLRSKNETQLDISGLANGLYTVEILEQDLRVATKRMVKH